MTAVQRLSAGNDTCIQSRSRPSASFCCPVDQGKPPGECLVRQLPHAMMVTIGTQMTHGWDDLCGYSAAASATTAPHAEIGTIAASLQDDVVLGVLRRHLADAKVLGPNVRLIEVCREDDGWELFVYLDRWAPEASIAIASLVSRAYRDLADCVPDAMVDNHVWEWSGDTSGCHHGTVHTIFSR